MITDQTQLSAKKNVINDEENEVGGNTFLIALYKM